MNSHYERHENLIFRFFHVAFTSSLRFYNDPATIIKRSHHAYSATSLRLSRSFYAHDVLTATLPRFIRLQHYLTTPTAIIARSYYYHTAIIQRSYCDLTTLLAIFCQHRVSYKYCIIPSSSHWYVEFLQIIQPKSTITRGRRGRGRERFDSNESWSSRYM